MAKISRLDPSVYIRTFLLISILICGIVSVHGGLCIGQECRWLAWKAWGDCSSTCGGGTRSRWRRACCPLHVWHDYHLCLRHCHLDGSDRYDYEKCNTFCYHGTYTTSCRCYPGYYDSCCNSRATCGRPGRIANGNVVGTSYYHGSRITYTCNQHYALTGGSFARTCKQASQNSATANWDGTQPRCAFVNSCGSIPCKNGATCVNRYDTYTCKCRAGWIGTNCQLGVTCGNPGSIANGNVVGNSYYHGSRITYTCNQHYNLTGGSYERTCKQVSRNSPTAYWDGTQPRCAFLNSCGSMPCKNGATCVNGYDTYTCRCKVGWSGTHCEFDIAQPTFSDCSTNKTYFTSERKRNVTWTTPTFTDPMGNSVKVTQNYRHNHENLPWGDFFIQYVATKLNNGLKTECRFTVSVLPNPCPRLVVPQFGAVACNGWSTRLGIVCQIFCIAGKEFPIGVEKDQLYVCGASGLWMPTEFEECEDALPASVKDDHHFPDSCSNALTKQYLADSYLRKLNKSVFSSICTSDKWKDECILDNVEILCP